jgi:hypothetical protein
MPLLLLFMALAALVAAPALAQPPAARSGSIAGTVLDRETRQPVAQASVTLEGLPLGAATDDEGRFTLRGVPPGSHRLRAWRLDYAPVIVPDVVVGPGREARVTIELAAEALPQGEVEVRARGFTRRKDQPASGFDMSYEEIRRSPGAIGDVFRLVQGLPGVLNSNDQRNDVVARGGSPSENLIRLDNVDVPNLSHFAAQGTTGGPISMLHNELVRDASFRAGGFPAMWGGRLSSVMDIRLREGNRERFESATDLTVAGFGQLFEGPLAGRGSWLLSLRTSYYDLVAEPFGITAIPYATSGQLKAVWNASPRDQLWLVNVSGTDHIAQDYDPGDEQDPFGLSYSSGGSRTVTGLNWQRLFGAGAWGTLVLSDAYARHRQDVFDPYLDGARIFHNRSGEGETVLRADLAGRARAAEWKTGAELRRLRADYLMEQPFGVANPFTTDTTRREYVRIERTEDAWQGAAYGQATRALGRLADLTLGARAERWGAIGATSFDPRAALVVHAGAAVDASVSYGLYHQQPALALVGAYDVNRDLAPMRCEHVVAGLAWTPASDVRVTLEAYRKRYSAYPVSPEFPAWSLANSGDQYSLVGLLMPLVSAGSGEARGLELYAQKQLTQGFYGQVSYGWSRSEHRALDGVLRRGGFDAPHAATLIAGWKRGAAWEFSTRFSWASGRPYTPALEPFSSDQGRWVLDQSRLNAARTPAYARQDLRADRRFTVGRRNVTLWLEVQNVWDRTNRLQYIWDADAGTLGGIPQIGFLPVLGVNVQL